MRPFAGVAAALVLAISAALPAAALDLENLTESERTALRAEIRQFLLDEPELLLEVIDALEAQLAQSQDAEDAALVAQHADLIFNDGHSWVGGNPEGDVTLVEFIDYTCPICREAHPEVQTLLEFDGNVRFIVKEFPILGANATLASRFAISVLQIEGDEAYGVVHDRLLSERTTVSMETLSRIAGDAGLDMAQISAHMDSPEVTAVIEANFLLAQQLQISGTPSFVVGERIRRGYLPLDTLVFLVEEARERD